MRPAIPLSLLAVLLAFAAPAPGASKPQRSRPPITTVGSLAQLHGASGCLVDRSERRRGCTSVRALGGPAPFLGSGAIAISRDGKNVYIASSRSDAITVLERNARTGKLKQRSGTAGCIAAKSASGCATARGLNDPNAVAVFARDASTGSLTQPDDATGCTAGTATDGCATGLALAAPEGMAISGDGDNVYVASAVSNALAVFTRNPSTGALTQPTDGTGCIANSALTGCTTGTQIGGANAVAVSSDDDNVYVTSLLSNSLTTFNRASSTGQLTQQTGTSACVIYVLAVGCSLGRALSAPEGLAVSSDGASVYAAAFKSGAVAVFNRKVGSGALLQKPRRPGCVTARAMPACATARVLSGVSSVAVSPDGRFLYSAAFASDAVGVFKRVTRAVANGKG